MTSVDRTYRERRQKRPIGWDGKVDEASGDIETPVKPALDQLRGSRSKLSSAGSTKRRVVPTSRMVSSSISRSNLSHARPVSRHRHKSVHERRSETEVKQRTRRKSISRDDSSLDSHQHEPTRPKRRSSTATVSERRRRDDSSDSHDDAVMSVVSEESDSEPKSQPKERKVKIVYVKEDQLRSMRRNSIRGATEDKVRKSDAKNSTKPLHRSNTVSSYKLRSQSAQDIRESQPAIKRSHSLSQSHLASKSPYSPSVMSSKATSKRASLFGIFNPTIKEEKPVRLVECLTCLSDDIPISKSAKLKCGHRMCHSCLKRIFRLSVNDPQHMPPKCCTSDHIPLKHVERLFDIPFKKLWNKKFQEYTTKNRIYCPSRRCGEWIKPGNIHSEGGKKYGKCGRCKTKVCCLCNGKWHGNKDCPKDEETNALLEAAKQAGWQRCYSCRTMVELKEGCNHMTCRCRAEFCMICGLKWKTCNCPWFNYEQVENDRLNHMRVAEELDDMGAGLDDIRLYPRPLNVGRPARAPRAYREELNARRRQDFIDIDEELARRLQVLGLGDDDDYNGGIGGIEGIGNARGHLMNEDFRRPAPDGRPANRLADINRVRAGAPPPPLPPPRPQLRRRAEQDNALPMRRNAERPILRRSRMDYASDAARHAPVTLLASGTRARPLRHAARPAAEPRPSVLAGLGGAGRGSGRVGAWRTHVEPGVVPAEGFLSM